MKHNTKKKEWVVGKDDVGRAMLQWTVDPGKTATTAAADPLAKTYNFLARLERPDLQLEGEYRDVEECDPYNSGRYSASQLRSKAWPGRG